MTRFELHFQFFSMIQGRQLIHLSEKRIFITFKNKITNINHLSGYYLRDAEFKLMTFKKIIFAGLMTDGRTWKAHKLNFLIQGMHRPEVSFSPSDPGSILGVPENVAEICQRKVDRGLTEVSLDKVPLAKESQCQKMRRG